MTRGVVTVFGGTGFLGRAAVRRLARAGWAVRVAARHPEVPAFSDIPGPVERMPVDLRDEDAVGRALAGADAAVNAVSLYVERDGFTFDAIHVDAAAGVARQTRAAGVATLVHISGIGAGVRSPSAYVAARGAGEGAVREAFAGAVILRPSVLFGRRGNFLQTLDALTRLPVIPLFGRGETRLQPVHVEDVAGAIARAVEMPEAAGHAFELGGADVLTYREILTAVLRHRGRRRLMLPVPLAVWHVVARVASVLPSPPVTRDQLVLLASDNVVGQGVANFDALDITPAGIMGYLAECLP